MAINRADIAKELLPGLNAIFGLEYGMVDDELAPLYEVENSKGAIIHLGVEDFRDGFALWLIVPDTPFNTRV